MLTVEQAADILNVSVTYVRKCIVDGVLYSLSKEDVLAFKERSDAECNAAAAELSALGQELQWDEP
jgi:excisionase family DNA binding protein